MQRARTIGQNLFKESAASGQPQQGTPGTNGLGIKQGAGYLPTERGEELVNMIETQRAYEMNLRPSPPTDQMLAKRARQAHIPKISLQNL